jgi:hypothetical protein
MELIRRGRIVFSRAPLILQSTDAGPARVATVVPILPMVESAIAQVPAHEDR